MRGKKVKVPEHFPALQPVLSIVTGQEDMPKVEHLLKVVF